MITVLTGNMFESNAQTWVNTVNCVGVMGKGIALEFKKRFPEMFEDYAERCAEGKVQLGRPYLFKRAISPWILLFPTKHHWRDIAQLDSIIEGLVHLKRHYRQWGITSLAVPPLGCGQGQLEWLIVGPTLYRHLAELDIPIELYAPHGTPHEQLRPSFLGRLGQEGDLPIATPKPQFIPAEWVALVEILHRIERQPYHWPVGRIMFEKILYVATEEGLHTGLSFRESNYGPFSREAKQLIARLQNHGLIQEVRHGKMIHVRVGPTFVDARKAYEKDLRALEPLMAKVADLFLRADTRHAEMIANVLFSARTLREQKSSLPTEHDVLVHVMQSKQKRRPPPSRADIAQTVRFLAALNHVEVKPSRNLPLQDSIPTDF